MLELLTKQKKYQIDKIDKADKVDSNQKADEIDEADKNHKPDAEAYKVDSKLNSLASLFILSR